MKTLPGVFICSSISQVSRVAPGACSTTSNTCSLQQICLTKPISSSISLYSLFSLFSYTPCTRLVSVLSSNFGGVSGAVASLLLLSSPSGLSPLTSPSTPIPSFLVPSLVDTRCVCWLVARRPSSLVAIAIVFQVIISLLRGMDEIKMIYIKERQTRFRSGNYTQCPLLYSRGGGETLAGGILSCEKRELIKSFRRGQDGFDIKRSPSSLTKSEYSCRI